MSIQGAKNLFSASFSESLAAEISSVSRDEVGAARSCVAQTASSQGGWGFSSPLSLAGADVAVPVVLLTPQIHLKAVRSKKIPMQQFKERLGLALPASPRSWEPGKLLPSNLSLPSSPGTQQQARGVPGCLEVSQKPRQLGHLPWRAWIFTSAVAHAVPAAVAAPRYRWESPHKCQNLIF